MFKKKVVKTANAAHPRTHDIILIGIDESGKSTVYRQLFNTYSLQVATCQQEDEITRIYRGIYFMLQKLYSVAKEKYKNVSEISVFEAKVKE